MQERSRTQKSYEVLFRRQLFISFLRVHRAIGNVVPWTMQVNRPGSEKVTFTGQLEV